ncbi:MAG: hypothetical protein OT477_22790 [Chloroflexi bacterium]|nr:hypothetical protein [Chloroflexota bacterium]
MSRRPLAQKRGKPNARQHPVTHPPAIAVWHNGTAAPFGRAGGETNYNGLRLRIAPPSRPYGEAWWRGEGRRIWLCFALLGLPLYNLSKTERALCQISPLTMPNTWPMN